MNSQAPSKERVDEIDQIRLRVNGWKPQTESNRRRHDSIVLLGEINRLRAEKERMAKVCKLASELCDAVDAADEDIGGFRPVNQILAELGPACDKAEGQ